jgi:hypothetical protein
MLAQPIRQTLRDLTWQLAAVHRRRRGATLCLICHGLRIDHDHADLRREVHAINVGLPRLGHRADATVVGRVAGVLRDPKTLASAGAARTRMHREHPLDMVAAWCIAYQLPTVASTPAHAAHTLTIDGDWIHAPSRPDNNHPEHRDLLAALAALPTSLQH